MGFTTKHLPEPEQTLAKVVPEDLTADERRLIMEGSLGYCEAHGNLYRKVTLEALQGGGMAYGLLNCPVPDICCKCRNRVPGHGPHISEFGPCKEW